MKSSASLDDIIGVISAEILNAADDVTFKKSFANFAPAENDVSEYYLRQIENYLKNKAGDRHTLQDTKSVEHIIPQKYELEKWYGVAPITSTVIPDYLIEDFTKQIINSIGNKALLFGDDNSSAGNNTYSDKLKLYKNGIPGSTSGNPYDTFILIKNLVDKYPTKFNHDEVLARAKELSEYAADIWK